MIIESQCQGMDVRIPVHKGAPGEPVVCMVNSASAIVIVCDEDGHVSSEMIPLIDAVERVERFIAKLRDSGAIEASRQLRERVQSEKVVALASHITRDR